MPTKIQSDATVLFHGDSVTEGGRNHQVGSDMGTGFAGMAAAWFSASHAEYRVKFLNRGVGGYRVKDVLLRWPKDFLPYQPTWVSILVGINNTWRAFDANDPTSPAAFERQYRKIIDHITNELHARIVLCDPFMLPVVAGQDAWRPDLNEKIAIVHQLAQEYSAILIPLDSIFAEASARRSAKFWLPDGVHPSPAGSALIARSWLAAVEAL